MDGLWWTNWEHWWEQVNSMLVEFHFFETKGSCRAWTWTACLTDKDANHFAISPPPSRIVVNRWNTVRGMWGGYSKPLAGTGLRHHVCVYVSAIDHPWFTLRSSVLKMKHSICMLPTCFSLCCQLVHQWLCHVLSCLCYDACKGSRSSNFHEWLCFCSTILWGTSRPIQQPK